MSKTLPFDLKHLIIDVSHTLEVIFRHLPCIFPLGLQQKVSVVSPNFLPMRLVAVLLLLGAIVAAILFVQKKLWRPESQMPPEEGQRGGMEIELSSVEKKSGGGRSSKKGRPSKSPGGMGPAGSDEASFPGNSCAGNTSQQVAGMI